MKTGTDGVILGAVARLPGPSGRCADIGAGSGLIALMIAQRYAGVTADAVEIDPEAARDLRLNIAVSPWSDRITAIEGCFTTSLEGKYDLIVSNPPFYSDGEESGEARRALARHCGTLSAASLVDFASGHLADGGFLAMIIPTATASAIIARAAFARLSLCRRIDVITSVRRGITRTVLEFSNIPGIIPEISQLAVGSDEFKELTRDFYLNF